MKWINNVMAFLHIVPSIAADEEINRGNEAALREHRELVDKVRAESDHRRDANSRLRAALTEAKMAMHMPVLGEFERAVQQERPGSVRQSD